MQDLESRRKQRVEREKERLASGLAIDPRPSDHGGEAQDPNTFENEGDGTGDHANAGANGHLGSREEGTAGSGSWPAAKPASGKPAAGKKDPTA